MKKRLITVLLVSFMVVLLMSPVGGGAQISPCSLGTPYRGCPACGKAKGERAQQHNVLKNRDESADNPTKVTVSYIRDPANNSKFDPNMAVQVTGYVASVTRGGLRESSNCGRTDLNDIHINIVAAPNEVGDETKYVVAEITPRWEPKLDLVDTTYDRMLNRLRGQIERKWVTFRGWMLYDYPHLTDSESTAPGNESNWRATPWEIHPVTSYQVLAEPPSEE